MRVALARDSVAATPVVVVSSWMWLCLFTDSGHSLEAGKLHLTLGFASKPLSLEDLRAVCLVRPALAIQHPSWSSCTSYLHAPALQCVALTHSNIALGCREPEHLTIQKAWVSAAVSFGYLNMLI